VEAEVTVGLAQTEAAGLEAVVMVAQEEAASAVMITLAVVAVAEVARLVLAAQA
jgi:hypothetical protein